MKARITTAMVEAGVNALANARKLSDEAIVSHIFQAMSAAMRLDEVRQRSEPQAPYNHQAWPAVFVGPKGQEQVFKSAEEVPEGWMTPDEYAAKPKAKKAA